MAQEGVEDLVHEQKLGSFLVNRIIVEIWGASEESILAYESYESGVEGANRDVRSIVVGKQPSVGIQVRI